MATLDTLRTQSAVRVETRVRSRRFRRGSLLTLIYIFLAIILMERRIVSGLMAGGLKG